MLERFHTIVRAYLIASFSSGFVIALSCLLLAPVELVFRGRWLDAALLPVQGLVYMPIFAPWVGLVVVVFALVPALIVIGVAEVVRVRSAAFYGSTGAIAGILCWGVLFRGNGQWFWSRLAMAWTAEQAFLMLAMLAVGMGGLAGGLVYWAIAGKTAGDWRVARRPGG